MIYANKIRNAIFWTFITLLGFTFSTNTFAEADEIWRFDGVGGEAGPIVGPNGDIYIGGIDGFYGIKPNKEAKFQKQIGVVKSTPIIVNNIIYVGAENGNLYAYTLDGDEHWSTPYLANGPIKSTPAIAGNGTIYIADDGNLHAVNPNGVLKWVRNLNGSPGRSSPVISPDGNTIYIKSNEELHAYSADNIFKWKFPSLGFITPGGSGGSINLGIDGVIYTGVDGGFYALNPVSGLPIWSRNINGAYPAIGDDGFIYVGSTDGNIYALHISNGADKESFPIRIGSIHFAPVISYTSDIIYTGNYDYFGGQFYALAIQGGIKYSHNEGSAFAGNGVYATPAIGRESIVYVSYRLSPSQSDIALIAIRPQAPIVTGPNITKNPTPTWNWSSIGGTNLYRYKLNNADLNQNPTQSLEAIYTPNEPLQDGSHILLVQECLSGLNNQCLNNNSWSEAGSHTIQIDTTAPKTQAISSTTTGSDLIQVELSCTDELGSGCKDTYYIIDDSNIPFPYENPISISLQNTLAFYSIDRAGNIETPQNLVGENFTTLTLELSQVNIPFNEQLDVAGRLTQLSEPEKELPNLTIQLLLIAPDGGQRTIDATTNNIGQFNVDDIGNFVQQGRYTIQAKFSGTAILRASSSSPRPILVNESAGYAVIVQGKIPNNEGLFSHNKTANRVYQTLLTRGFDPENIQYFNYDTTQDGVDAIPEKAAIASAVENWAANNMNVVPAPFYLIMVDHGGANGSFFINSEIITPTDIGNWLSTLESKLNNASLQKERVLIVGSCYSGAFISEETSSAGRIIITSSAADEVSYKGPLEDDDIRVGEFFLEEFFHGLGKGATLRSAFVTATNQTEIFTRSGATSGNSNTSYSDNAVQHPLLDDNGDSNGSNVLGSDGNVAAQLKLGVDVDSPTNSPLQADIIDVTEPVHLPLDLDKTSATIWAKVNFNWRVQTVWVEVRSPTLHLEQPSTIVTLQIDNNLPRHFLTKDDNDLNSTARFDKTLNVFQSSGIYELYYFVRDNQTKEISSMVRSLVYKNRPGSNAPNPFNLISPPDNDLISLPQIFRWEATTDPDGDSITYRLLISDDANFTNIVHRQDELTSPYAAVGANSGLQTEIDYYWKVEAIDAFGLVTVSNQTFQFRVGGTNPNALILSGKILSDANQLYLTNPKISSVTLNGKEIDIDDPKLLFIYTGLNGKTVYELITSGAFGEVKVTAIADDHSSGSASKNWSAGDRGEIKNLNVTLPVVSDQIFKDDFETP